MRIRLASLAVAMVTILSCDHPATTADTPRIRVIRTLYASLVAPHPQHILTGEETIDVFAENVRGRVTPLGHYDDRESVLEYFYGLVLGPGINATGADFQKLLESGDTIAVAVDIHVDATQAVIGRVFTLRQTGFFHFDATDHIDSFDLAILNLGAITDPQSQEAAEATIAGTCLFVTSGLGPLPATCPNEFAGDTPDARYQDCVAFMKSIPYGTFDRAHSNTFTCRLLHSLLTPFRPQIHCPHVGKTGGGMCVDTDYNDWFLEDF